MTDQKNGGPGPTYIRPEAFSDANRSRFVKDGYVYIQNALQDAVVDGLLGDLENKSYLKVESPTGRQGVTTFFSKNGENLIKASPLITPLEREMVELSNWLSGETYAPLDNRSIGASVNVTPAGGGFGTHFDRQEISAIAYLNSVEGGALDLWPRLRRWEPKWLGKKAARVTMALTLALPPVSISPTRGSLLIFTKYTPHRVAEVKGERSRVSLVYGLDRPGVSFLEGQEYYGDAEESVTIGSLR